MYLWWFPLMKIQLVDCRLRGMTSTVSINIMLSISVMFQSAWFDLCSFSHNLTAPSFRFCPRFSFSWKNDICFQGLQFWKNPQWQTLDSNWFYLNKFKHFTLTQLHHDALVLFCSPPSDHVAFVYCAFIISSPALMTDAKIRLQANNGLTRQTWVVGITTEHQVHELLFLSCVVCHSGR